MLNNASSYKGKIKVTVKINKKWYHYNHNSISKSTWPNIYFKEEDPLV